MLGADTVRYGAEAGQRPFALHIDGREGGVRDNNEVHLVRQGRGGPDGRAADVQVFI